MKKLIILTALFLGCDKERDRLTSDCVRSHETSYMAYDYVLKIYRFHTDTVCDEYERRVIISGRKYRFKILDEVK